MALATAAMIENLNMLGKDSCAEKSLTFLDLAMPRTNLFKMIDHSILLFTQSVALSYLVFLIALFMKRYWLEVPSIIANKR